ncbi:protein SPMIP1-like [Mobula hypostoma]|uniref:protein SPMIP1-like n=1 Tax=Mobula hypostoma TaxID=723540 RepID=UPI002FC35C1B
MRMERKLNMDTQLQNFWKESMTKEDLLRFCWLRHFKGDLSKPPARVTERKKVPTLPHGGFQIQDAAVQGKEGGPSKEVKQKKLRAKEQAPTVSMSDMRPVTPEVRALLYDGFSKEDKGRYQYLKARKKKGPSEKYEYPLTTSWNYGWKIGESLLARLISRDEIYFAGQRVKGQCSSKCILLCNLYQEGVSTCSNGMSGSINCCASFLTEDNAEYKKPGFGRSALVETTFYRRNGIFSEPEASDVMN